ncbi:MAG: prolyl oligopeptidase family serine peptidase [Chloroflexota bacterium]
MTEPHLAPYGSWSSPITAASIAAGSISLHEVRVSSGDVYWLEGRPSNAGRVTLVRCRADGQVSDVTPPGWNVRSRAHEYGGGAYLVHQGSVFFSNFSDQRLYRLDESGEPRPITPEPEMPAGARYADACITPDGAELICVRELHAPDREPLNELVAIPVDGSSVPRPVVSGADFYAAPSISPDGALLAWLRWDHPNMPWDGTELWVADRAPDGALTNARRIAGSVSESIFQPAWSPDGTLYFVSDRSGWWNLYRLRGGVVQAVAPVEAELGTPQWVFGLSTYCFLADGRIACVMGRDGLDHLGLITPGTMALDTISTPFTSIGGPNLRALGNGVVLVGASASRAPAVVRWNVDVSDGPVLRQSLEAPPNAGVISQPRPLTFPGQGGPAYAFFYPPAHAGWQGPEGELPPLIVISHGGPTSAAHTALSLTIQFWTSRGLAVVDVNYGGSSGFGRDYRRRLAGQWGVVDARDCIAAAQELARQGLVDGQRLAIRGGSAGGYTTLCALTFHDVFQAGTSYYGVADCEALATDTHKFESRYLDRLIGPYPQAKQAYYERSPVHFAERISCPMILFQGLDDAVVPPSQAEMMVRALQAKGLPHAYLTFAGEQHGFRQASTIQRTLEAELSFYAQIFGFAPADALEPLAIVNATAPNASKPAAGEC